MSLSTHHVTSFRRWCANVVFSLLMRIISLILSYPRLAIVAPALAVFICSYPWHYGLLVGRLTRRLADTEFVASPSQIASVFSPLNDLDFTSSSMSKFTLIGPAGAPNVLSPDIFKDLVALQLAVANTFNDTVVVLSPLLCLDPQVYSRPMAASITQLVNSGFGYSLCHDFFNRFREMDRFVTYAHDINMFVFYPETTDIVNFVKDFAQRHTSLVISQSLSAVGKSLVLLFSQYFLYSVNESRATTLYQCACLFVLYTAAFLIVSFVYFALANEKELRSRFGVFVAWLYSVYFSVVCAFHLVEGTTYGFSSSLDPITRLVLVIVVMVLSCAPYFQTVSVLSNKGSPALLHRRFLRLYTGYHGVPMVVQPFLISFLCASLSLVQFMCLFRFISCRETFTFIVSGAVRVGLVCFVSMFIMCCLLLSFVLAIISIDLKVVDVTQALDDTTGLESTCEFKGDVNFISSYLLKLSCLSHLRPKRTTLRYRVGILLSQIHYPRRHHRKLIVVVTMLLLIILGISWLITLPIEVFHHVSITMDLNRTEIVALSHSALFYLEELLSVILFVVIFLIIFRLAYTRRGFTLPSASIRLRSIDFQNEEKCFNNIDLVAPGGPTQDILQIKTNPTSPYLVSISLDHKILIWSPLTASPSVKPINISTTLEVEDLVSEFWPVNHLEISNDGGYIILVNFNEGCVKCYERARMAYIWQTKLPVDLRQSLRSKQTSILESFFRCRNVPGYLRRMSLLKRATHPTAPRDRSTSDASSRPDDSFLNGGYIPPPGALTPDDEALLAQMKKEDYVMVLSTGDLLSFSCSDGSLKITNMLREAGMSPLIGNNVLCARKVSTPRVNDRILCQTLRGELILATISNNKWLYRQFHLKTDSYDREPGPFVDFTKVPSSRSNTPSIAAMLLGHDMPTLMAPSSTSVQPAVSRPPLDAFNEPVIVAVEFVGMVVRVCEDNAELIDLLNGIVLKSFTVGRFKPRTLKVIHLEPTHCKFCGCASIQSLSVVYEDFNSKTVILHTFKIDLQRSKSNICLRVERDPREIRCAGFSAVNEHQRSLPNMEKWVTTDINIVVGFQEICSDDINDDDDDDHHHHHEEPGQDLSSQGSTSATTSSHDFKSLVNNGGLASLRARTAASEKLRSSRQSSEKFWQGCIMTALDGKTSTFRIRKSSKLMEQDFTTATITCAQKYGYKSICIGVGSYMGIFYLGGPVLIEEDIYFSGSVATIPLDLESSHSAAILGDTPPRQNRTVNSQLLFINKRRRGLDRPRIVDV